MQFSGCFDSSAWEGKFSLLKCEHEMNEGLFFFFFFKIFKNVNHF